MTGDEFKTWLTDYTMKFPSVARWLHNLGEEHDRGIRRAWLDTLRDVPLRDAMRVTLGMARGDLDRVGSFDHEIEQTAVVIRRAARRLEAAAAAARHEPASADEDLYYRYRAGVLPASALRGRSIVEEYQRLEMSGMSKADIAHKLFPIGEPDPYNQPRYRCLDCRDIRRVTVWSYEAMAAWRAGRLASCTHRSMTGPCCCEAARIHLYDPKGPKPRGNVWPIGCEYSPDRFCKSDDFYSEEAIERFGRWCKEYFDVLEAKRHGQAPALPYKDDGEEFPP